MSVNVKNLTFYYGNKKILNDVSLTVNSNEVLTILGPNGAGKTTLLNIIAGLTDYKFGEILLDGKQQKNIPIRLLSRLIGYVPQSIVSTFDFSVLDYVVTGCAPMIGTFQKPSEQHFETARRAIAQMGIEHLQEKSYCRISGGERQQVSIARVIAQKPSYILMDEPTSHLDYGNQIRVLKMIKELAENGFGVVFTTHNPDHVLLLNHKVAVLDKNGSLCFGKPEDVINEDYLSLLYGTKLCVTEENEKQRSVCYPPNL